MGQKQSSPFLVVGVAAVLLAGGYGAWRVLGERAAATRPEQIAAASVAPVAPAAPSIASRSRVQAINKMNEGIQLYDRNNLAGAEQALQAAIQLDPSYAAAHHTLGQIYKKQNKLAEAEAAFQGATATMGAEPNGEYFYDLGAVQNAQGDAAGGNTGERDARYRAAIGSFQAALKLDPQLYKAHYRLGVLHEKLGMFEPADAAYRKSMEIKPSYSPAFVSLGNMYLDRGDTTTAMTVLRQGIELNDKDARMWNGLGRAHFTLGQMKEAVDAFSKAKKIDPDGVDALYGLGMAHAQLDQREQARDNLTLFISKAGADTRPDLLTAARDTIARMQ